MAHACRPLSEFLYTLQEHFAICIPSVRICRPSVSGSSFRYSAVCLFRTDLSPVRFTQLFQVFGSVSLPYRPATRLFQAALSGIQQCIASVRPAARLLTQLFQTPDSVSFPVQTRRSSVSGCSFRYSAVCLFRTDLPLVCFRLLFQAFSSVSLLCGPPPVRFWQLFQTPDSVSFPVQTCRPSASSSFFRHSTDMPALCS